jgi:hypothetical protein
VSHGDETEPTGPVEVPAEDLAPETLRALIEAFVNREGTDYGAVERTLEQKVADVRRQLERGEARIVFDPATQSVTLLPVARSGGGRP